MANKKRGTTLVEIIAVLAIIVIIGGVVYSLFGSTSKVYNKTHGQVILQDEMRLLTTSLEDDIRVGYTSNVEVLSGNKHVKFKQAAGTEFTIDFTGVGLNSKIEYAFEKASKYFAYVSYEVPSTNPVKRVVTKYECTASGATEFLKYTSKIETMECIKRVTPTPIMYEVNIKINDRHGNELIYNSDILPRN